MWCVPTPVPYCSVMDRDDDLRNRFEYHAPNEAKKTAHEKIRWECHCLADLFNELLPDGRDKALAITQLEIAMFWANASIARNQEPIP
jgi:hypothetical protein